jgi:hypothetical protein
MVPQGAFAQSIYRKKLPPGIDYYLIFGYKGNRNPLRPNNDGVVTLATQLDPRVQAEAKLVYGFDEDHDSILTCKRVAAFESGQVFGPFASGRYVVCLVAGGFRVKPTKQEVTIGAEQTADLNFKLIPTGSVSGFITRRFYKGSDPAGTYMMYGFDVPLRAIRRPAWERHERLIHFRMNTI